VESGSHDELLALGGRYARSWSNQMKNTEHDGVVTVGDNA
jgi:hypothetical protein